MSKRNSATPSNTLFNYFTKTPPATKKTKSVEKDESASPVSAKSKDSKIGIKKRERQASPQDIAASSDDEAPIVPCRRKRIRLNVDSDDSDAENKADNVMDTSAIASEAETSKANISMESKLSDCFKYTPSNKTPKQHKESAAKLENSTTAKPTASTEEPQQSTTTDDDNWVHCRLDFLKPEHIRDAQKRRPDHPDYDASTLYVPPEFLKQQTPAHRQWWELKAAHYDCVLFFKVGKFYELYHMDAAVGVNELGFSYMKGEFAHSGFPESAYERMAAALVGGGRKVARVEQTETPDAMAERCRSMSRQATKFDKVVRREVCQVAARGAHAPGLQDRGPRDAAAAYMLAVAEEDHVDRSTYGVCFVDATVGALHLGQFDDDAHSSRLLTALAHMPPAIIIRSRRGSARASRLLASACPAARAERAALPAADRTLALLADKYYRADDGGWPAGLTPHLDRGDPLGLTPAKGSHLAIVALGGVVDYLTRCLLDIQILGMRQVATYTPPDVLNETLLAEDRDESRCDDAATLVLDAVTLHNLRIVQDEGCLYDRVNFCSTPFGKRLLYQWVCAPPRAPAAVRARQLAVRALCTDTAAAAAARAALARLPDLERLLAKIHAFGSLRRATQHPDSRAIFYEEKTYSKRKIQDFMSLLSGLETLLELQDIFKDTDSELLRELTSFPPKGTFPDYRDTLKYFQESFDAARARAEGVILPAPGADAEHDAVLRAAARAHAALDAYLAAQEAAFGCRLKYVGTDKKRYQLEVPEAAAARAGGGYTLEGARKGYKRFSTAETKELLAEMMAIEEQKATVLKDLARRIFAKFSDNHATWAAAAGGAARLDALLSLAEYSRRLTGDVCLPELVDDCVEPFLSITGGRHPCTDLPDFIPNDTALGAAPGAAGTPGAATALLLTGPNMGGKSTLMRQMGLLTVLAHLGSYVPAATCRLSPVDRVFTRLGARDDLRAGRSTFLVEMSEAASIVRHATRRSLVLLDELGRGTSTYDGAALAAAVCAALASRGARLVFATHYHSAVAHLAAHPRVTAGHMACMVETEEAAADADRVPEESITFLYKLSAGACPKSYGFNAARLAGVPRDVTRRARGVASRLEGEAAAARAFKRLMKPDAAGVRATLRALVV